MLCRRLSTKLTRSVGWLPSKSSKSKLLIAKFKSADSLNGWEIRQGTYFQDAVVAKYDGGMDSKFEFTENGDAVFSGYVFTRGGYVELSKNFHSLWDPLLTAGVLLLLNPFHPKILESFLHDFVMFRYEGLVFSVGGNGRSHVVILETGPSVDTSQSKMYFARISTKVGFCRVRVPFSSFRPVKPNDPPLNPSVCRNKANSLGNSGGYRVTRQPTVVKLLGNHAGCRPTRQPAWLSSWTTISTVLVVELANSTTLLYPLSIHLI
ncbi:putative ovule protein [Forsythia ovata]|uniref:Ovule protein n=1 Tax=Forsythia ovata TaxID=205694 RepID=A0ABD1SRD7_9LAMI